MRHVGQMEPKLLISVLGGKLVEDFSVGEQVVCQTNKTV